MQQLRKQEEQAARRIRMLDAAERLLLEHGIEGTTMDAVAAAAGFTKRTLYQYFPSKEAVVACIALRAVLMLNRLTAEGVAEASTGLDQAYACGEAFVRFQREQAGLYRLMERVRTLDWSKIPEASAALLMGESARNAAFLESAITTGIADGTIRAGFDPRRTAFLVRAFSGGLVAVLDEVEALGPGCLPFAREEILDDALVFLGNALAPAGAACEQGKKTKPRRTAGQSDEQGRKHR